MAIGEWQRIQNDSNVAQCQLCPNLYGRSSKTDRESMVLILDGKFKSLAVSTIFSLELNGGILMGYVSRTA